ncbi:MAG: aspartate ammonia-lyase [Candidatus Peregrinibacteria bacterium]
MEFRNEKDTLGTFKVPKNSYFGAFTARAQKNFQISGKTAPQIFQKSLGLVKLAALKANSDLKLLPPKLSKAIQKAAEEFVNLKFSPEFTLDIFQAGAGTSYNMNANEIIANRANELLKAKKGEYSIVHPNNHVNLSQSSNDVIPTATRLATLLSLPPLLNEIQNLEKEISRIATKYKNEQKVGRTHLRDAVPITLGQEFDSYKQAITNSKIFIENQAKNLRTIGLGGTAVGMGTNAHPKFKTLATKHLSALTGITLKSAENLTETTNNMAPFMNFSAALRSLATNLLNFSNDIKLLSMGPRAGIAEITLPEIQPGSSIMPGKNNPSVPEALEMVCFQVLGNDRTIELSAQRSQLELNAMCPIIMHNLLESIHILTNAIKTFTNLCLKGLKVNAKQIKKLLEQSLAQATVLAPKLGYDKTAKVIKLALKNNTTIEEELKNL